MISRAGDLCRRSGLDTPEDVEDHHDRRSDVPSIGVQTIKELSAAGAGCVAIGRGRVILIDRPAVLAAADRAGIAIVGVASSCSEG